MGIGRIGQTITVVNKSGDIVSNSKHLVNVFKEAKSAYRERKAEVRAVRDAEQERKHLLEPSPRPKPPVERGYSDSLFAAEGPPPRFRREHNRSSTLSLERTSDQVENGQRGELTRRHSDGDYDTVVRRKPGPRLPVPHPEDGLAYGELPPPLPIRPYDDSRELKGKMSKLTVLLDELNCVQHSATAIIANLQKNPEALAAVALTLAEISNLSAKLAPGALAAMKGSFPLVIALLASPQFLIAAGVGVGVTVVMLGGYKIIKRVKAKKEKESAMEMDELQEITEDISRIETWRRGIAEAEASSVSTSVDGEFITPYASRQLLDAGVLSEHDIKSTKSSRRSSRSEKGRKAKAEKKSKDSKSEKKLKTKKEPSGIRMLFRKD